MEEYHTKMKITMIHARIDEWLETTMIRFLEGLNKEIVNIHKLQNYVALEERQLKGRGTNWGYVNNTPQDN